MKTTRILDAINDPEIVERIVSRRDLLRQGGTATTAMAIASVPVLLSVFAKSAFAQGSGLPQQVKDVLNFALTLEYLEDEFYRAGLAASALIPAADQAIFAQISKHEVAHVALLKTTLGADAVAKPTFDFTAKGAFPDVFTNYETFKTLSQGFEDTGVRAYKGQAANLQVSPDILTVALQIHSVEARHASEIRRLRGGFSESGLHKGWITGNQTDVPALAATYAGEENFTQGGVALANSNAVTEAFDEPLTKDQVLAIAGPFIV